MADRERELVAERGDVHLGAVFEHDHPGAACGLGPVHRGVGAQEQLRRRVIGGSDRETEAGGHDRRIRAQFARRPAHRVAQTLGDLPGGVRLVEPVEEHHELVAAPPRDRVAGPHAARHCPRESAQDVVADTVAERVVDVLHGVDIDEDHRNPAPVASSMRERHAHAIVEDRPSGQAGEIVVDEIGSQRRRRWPRDLAAVGDETVHLTARADTRHHRHRHRHGCHPTR